MSLLSRVYGRLGGFPPVRTSRVAVERDLQIRMPDGEVLFADRWFPDSVGAERAPILLARTPYGRMNIIGRIYAERGYQTVMVRCRGTFGSGGHWEPFRNEQADGKAVLEWLAAQSWFSGRVGGFGGSYWGLTQWAVASSAPQWLTALTPSVTASNFRHLFYPGGSFALESALVWIHGLVHQESGLLRRGVEIAMSRRRLAPALATMPLADADEVAVGRRIDSFQDWLEHDDPEDPWWAPLDFGSDLEKVPPMSMVAGWYDVFLPYQLDDFRKLRESGREVRMTVGPWTHSSPAGGTAVVRDSLEWADTQLLGRRTGRRSPVRVFVMGARRWIDLDEWPPPATPARWYLHSGGTLATDAPAASPPDRYRYDPVDPTPGIGGASLSAFNSGAKDNRRLEARADVLTYTTQELIDDVTVIGEVTAKLHVRSSLDHTDFFVRVCDVSPSGRSMNVSDGILRVKPGNVKKEGDDSFRLTIPLFPTAMTFARGHRIRLQVSSGAHPVYARNPGSGEPLGKATTLVTADQEVFHDPEHPSFLELPVVSRPIRGGGRLARLRSWRGWRIR